MGTAFTILAEGLLPCDGQLRSDFQNTGSSHYFRLPDDPEVADSFRAVVVHFTMHLQHVVEILASIFGRGQRNLPPAIENF